MKKNRRMEVGPFATFHFENYDTMWAQVHGNAAHRKGRRRNRFAGELEAYNPLIPQGSELIATLMLEIERSRTGATANSIASRGIEESTYIELAGQRIAGTPTEYDERTTPGRQDQLGALGALHLHATTRRQNSPIRRCRPCSASPMPPMAIWP